MDDDAVLLLVRTRLLDAGQVAVGEFSADPAKVATVRAMTTRQLREWGLEQLSFSTELIVSELFTNAIRYADGPVLVRLIHDRGLVCEVCDTGHTSPHLRHAARVEEGGRGLYIVAQITRGWAPAIPRPARRSGPSRSSSRRKRRQVSHPDTDPHRSAQRVVGAAAR